MCLLVVVAIISESEECEFWILDIVLGDIRRRRSRIRKDGLFDDKSGIFNTQNEQVKIAHVVFTSYR